jgi:hypothetical protein
VCEKVARDFALMPIDVFSLITTLFFTKDSKKAATEPGAVYIQGMDDGTLPTPDENLPVATPIEAECVAAAPPVKYDDHKPAAITSPATENPGLMNMQNDPQFGRKPCMMAACPHCGLESRTKVRTHPNLITWALSILLLFLFWPLCWVPLVVDRVRAMCEVLRLLFSTDFSRNSSFAITICTCKL